jgi:transcriptional regulator with XRE-family HTH domain
MPWIARLDDPEALRRFGRNLRRARQIAGLSQQRLADLSGVSQSVISRLERAKAPMVGLERLLLLARALGPAWPLGECPHDHSCVWQVLDADAQRQRSGTLDPNAAIWNVLN